MLMASVDFPLPVRPNKPTRSPGPKLKDTLRKTEGSSGAYLTVRFSTEIKDGPLLLEGQ